MQERIPSDLETFQTSYNTAFQAGFRACAVLLGVEWRAALDEPGLSGRPLDVLGELPQFEQHLLVSKAYKPSALANARSVIRKFAVFWEGQGIPCYAHSAQQVVNDFLATFAHPAYRYTAIHYLRLFFDFLGWEINPARQVKLPQINRAQGRHFLSPHESRVLAALLNNHVVAGRHAREQVLFFLLLYTGLRIGEALALKWEDIGADGTVFVRDSKTHKGRVVYAPKRVLGAMAEYKKACAASPYVFPGTMPLRPISYGVVRMAFKALLKKAGIDRPGCNLHSLRHTFARACVQAGMPREVIQQFLGHQDIRTTEIYTRLLSEDVRKQSPAAHRAVSAFLGGRQTPGFHAKRPR